jgi:hypothetical protein
MRGAWVAALAAAALLSMGITGCPEGFKLAAPAATGHFETLGGEGGSLPTSKAIGILSEGGQSSRLSVALASVADDDRVEEALMTAVCSGMEQLADTDPNTRATNWRDFLVGQLKAQLSSALVPRAIEDVDSLLNAWDIGQVNAQGARVYLRACGPKF